LSDPAGLPEEVARAADLLLDSLDALTLLIVVAREPNRIWTLDQVAERLHISRRDIGRELDGMCRRGLLAVAGDGTGGDLVSYRFAPADEECAAAANEILEAYGSRRIDLTNHVAARAFERLLSTQGRARSRDES